jgi:mannitol 2-dehydrogenase
VHEAAQDPLFRDLLLGYMDEEATPTLLPVPGVDLGGYKHTLIERFSNGEVRDTVARLCAFSSDRIPTWLVPVIREQLAAGRGIRRCALVVAGWARYMEGTDEDGEPIDIVDRLGEQLTERARRQREEPLAFLRDRQLFGDLAENESFAEAYRSALASLHREGARATVQRCIATTGRNDEESPPTR